MKKSELAKLQSERRKLMATVETKTGMIQIERQAGELSSHAQHRIDIWLNVIASTRKKMAVLDHQIGQLVADEAAAEVHLSNRSMNTAQRQIAKVQHAILTLVSNRRVGQSSELIRRKIERLCNPATSFGVRVADSWADFVNMIQAKPLPPIPQTMEKLPTQAPYGDDVPDKLKARDVHVNAPTRAA
jgi:hypothetical protein